MKKFLIKIALFFLTIAIPFLILNGMYKRTNYWKSSNELYNIRVHDEKISLVNVGNSHEMNSLRYEKYYKGHSANFATSSQPFYYSYQVLTAAEESIEEDAVVIIPISYFDWYYNWAELFSAVKTYNNRYYSVLPPWKMYDFNFDLWLECGVFPLLTAKDNVQYIFQDIAAPVREPVNEAVVGNALVDVADYKYNSWCNDVMDLGIDKDKKYEQNLYYFTKMIDYCLDKGYTPVIICTPVTEELYGRFSAEFMNDFYRKNHYIQELYPDVLFLDYSRDMSFTTEYTYYKDSDHMNSVGGEIYTKRVLQDLVANGVIDANMVNLE